MKIHEIQNVLQNVLTLINRLCITICLKFYQSNILAITLATKAYGHQKNSAHYEKKPPRIEKMAQKKKKKSPLYEKSLPLPTRGRKRQWRSEGNWRPGANLNFAPPPSKKFLKNDTEMSSIQLIMCIIISA